MCVRSRCPFLIRERGKQSAHSLTAKAAAPQRALSHLRSLREVSVHSAAHVYPPTSGVALEGPGVVPIAPCASLLPVPLQSSTGSSVRLFGESQPWWLKNIPDAARSL